MKYSLSDAGLAGIKSYERPFYANKYTDFAGKATIGWGHLYRGGDTYANLTQAQGDELLRLDCRVAEDHVNTMVSVPLNQNQFDALVSFTFNEGGAHLAESTTLRLLNEGDYDGASAALMMWDKYVDPADNRLKVSASLVIRRTAERAMFEAPLPPRTSAADDHPAAIIERDRPTQ